MKSVAYNSRTALSCGCNATAIICLPPELVSGGEAPYILGTVTFTGAVTDCRGYKEYQYSLVYNEGQLNDPSVDLVTCDIEGVFCVGCLTSYIDYQASRLFAGTVEYKLPTTLPTPGQTLSADSVSGNIVTLVWT
jgi:hypothetical protein